MARKSPEFKLSPEQQKMATENMNLARREAWRIQKTTGIDYVTLEGVAFMGLCKACYRYKPESGYKFSSLATPTIRGELLHWVRDKTYSMRLSHKMRENWVKGRKLLYKGYTDIQISKELNIPLESWQETRSACSGPPLELKDQATPTEPLEPEEIDFAVKFLEKAKKILETISDEELFTMESYFMNSSKGSQRNVAQIIAQYLNDFEGDVDSDQAG